MVFGKVILGGHIPYPKLELVSQLVVQHVLQVVAKGEGGGFGIPGASHPVHGWGVTTGMAWAPHDVHPLLDFGADPGTALV